MPDQVSVAAAAAGAEVCPSAQECPTPEQLALLAQWNSLQSGFRRLNEELLAEVATRTGLAPSSFQALWFLLTAPGGSAPMNQLTSALGFTTAGTTNLADRLSCAGLLERRPAPGDRRVTLAVLTQQGQASATAAALVLADALRERLVVPLGPDGLSRLADTIAALAADPCQQAC